MFSLVMSLVSSSARYCHFARSRGDPSMSGNIEKDRTDVYSDSTRRFHIFMHLLLGILHHFLGVHDRLVNRVGCGD